MKNLFLTALLFLVSINFFAQPPQGMSYQSVIRDANGDLMAESIVGIQISIIQDSPSGAVVYVETHSPMTNINGLASLTIGMGTPISGSYPVIDWSVPNYIKTETDPAGGSNYVLTSTSQLLAVPYALHALDVSNKDDADSDPTNEIELPPGGQNGQFLRIVDGVPTWVFPDIDPPSVPLNFSYSNETPTSLDLSWSPSTDNIAVGGYNVMQNGTLTSGITETTYQVTGLLPSNSYDFYVQSYDVDGNNSAFSSSLYLDREPPTAPQGLFANNFAPSSSTLDLHWSPSTDDVGMSYYEVFQNGAFVDIVLANNLTYQFTGLTSFTSYEYNVRGIDHSGNVSELSDTLYVDRQPPTAPSDFLVTYQPPNELSFSWTAAQDDQGIGSYFIREVNGLVFDLSVPGSTTSINASFSNQELSLQFEIRAEDSSDNQGPWSDIFYVDFEAPSAPQNLFATNVEPISGTTLDLNWSAATDDVGIAEYEIWINGSPFGTSSPNNLTYTVNGLTPNTSYEFYIRATDSASNLGEPSNTIYVDRQPPTVPGDFDVFSLGLGIGFSWEFSQDDQEVDFYRIEEINGLGNPNFITVSEVINNVSIALPDNPGGLEYRMRATDINGHSSPWTDIFYLDLTPPSNPSTYLVSASGTACPTFEGKFTYSHSASSDNIGVVLYEMYVDGLLVESSPNIITYQTPCVPISPEPSVCVIAYDEVGNASSCN